MSVVQNETGSVMRKEKGFYTQLGQIDRASKSVNNGADGVRTPMLFFELIS